MADPIQPMAGSQLYNQVQQQMNSGGHQPNYSGGQFPGGATMGGGSVGAGGFSMPQLSTMGAATQMGQSNPFGGGSSSPFGGGEGIGGAGDSIKKLVDTNKDLIAALKDLTKGIKAIGGGGPGGMPGMGGLGGSGGGGLGDSGLSNKLLSNIARGRGGMIDLQATPEQLQMEGFGQSTPGYAGMMARGDAFMDSASALAGPGGGAPPAQIYRGGAFQPNPAFNQYHDAMTQGAMIGSADDMMQFGGPNDSSIYTPSGRLQAPGRFSGSSVRQGFSNFGRALVGLPQQMSGQYQQATVDQARQSIANSGYGSGAQSMGQGVIDANQGTDANLPENQSSFGKAAGRFGHAAGRVIGAGGTNMSEIVSQIPYVGGIMSAPLNVLEGRLQGAMQGELPGIIHSGFGQGSAQGGGHINTHSAFLKTMRDNLGIGAADALNMGNEVLNAAGGQQISNLGGRMTAAMANGINVGDVGVNASFGRAGMNLRTTGLTGTRSIKMAMGMGLKGQAASDFLGAVGGLGSQFGAMGIDLQGDDVARDISDIHRSGFSSLQGKLAVEGFSRMRQKGGIAAAQGLGGMFGGVGSSLLMADALDRSGGDFDAAGKDLEDLGPFGNRKRLAQIMGVGEDDEVVQMMMMGQGLSYAERHIKRTQQDQIGASFNGGAQADAIFTKKQAQLDADRLTNSYGANRNNLTEMLRINKKIEDKLIDGVTVKHMESLVSTVADVSNVVNKAASNIARLVGMVAPIMQKLAQWLGGGGTPPTPPGTPPSAPSDERLKKDIIFIGVSDEGYNIYEFVYIDDEDATVYQGVMAQQVIKVKPEAVYVDQRGYYGVHYNLIDVEFRKVV